MASSQIITPFPTEIDREKFAGWIPGFADGEAHFRLTSRNNDKQTSRNAAAFTISLRRDDAETLQLIRLFWQCGHIHSKPGNNSSKPGCTYAVTRIEHLHDIIVPHFHQYPLNAKKQEDFVIWERGVELLLRVKRQHRIMKPDLRTGQYRGSYPKWNDTDRDAYDAYAEQLKTTRKFRTDRICVPKLPLATKPRNVDQSLIPFEKEFTS